MEVILLERVAKLGQMGEVVRVKDGYARNFLLPQGKALRANPRNLERFEAEKAQREARNAEMREEAARRAEALDGQSLVIIRSASDAGALYGSVTTRDIAEAAAEAGFEVQRGQVVLPGPIKELGLHDARIVLHPEVEATLHLNVARSQDEAQIQAEGRSLRDIAAEEEAAAEFEIQNLFDDLGGAMLDETETREEQRSDKPAVQEKRELDRRLGRDEA